MADATPKSHTTNLTDLVPAPQLNLGSCDCPAEVICTKRWQTTENSKSEVLAVKMTDIVHPKDSDRFFMSVPRRQRLEAQTTAMLM